MAVGRRPLTRPRIVKGDCCSVERRPPTRPRVVNGDCCSGSVSVPTVPGASGVLPMQTIAQSRSIEEILNEAGVGPSSLASHEAESLDREGFVVLTDLIDSTWLAQLRDVFETLHSNSQSTAATR